MDSSAEAPPQDTERMAESRFAGYDAGMESLNQSISLLRAWAAYPQMFDHINSADRQNLFLIALELAESAQARLSSLN